MKVRETEFHAWLSNIASEYIERWRELCDEMDTQSSVVDCLRSLNARFRFHQKPVTEFQDKYKDKEIDWNLAIPKKINQAGTSTQPFKKNSNAVFKQRLEQEKLEEALKQSKGKA